MTILAIALASSGAGSDRGRHAGCPVHRFAKMRGTIPAMKAQATLA
jgi:hypothetical protein